MGTTQRRWARSLWAGALGIGLAQGMQFATPGLAHQVEISGDVGGTVHIEPNDLPRAGEASQAWFALVKQGGNPIPLSECDCQLAVYPQPYKAGDAPVQQPPLQPVTQEGYANIPGAEITFPQVGTYVLVMQGKPKTGATFQPFELQFDVTVATGRSATSPSSSVPTSTPTTSSPATSSPATTSASPSAETTATASGENRTNANTAQPTGIVWAAAGLLVAGIIAAIWLIKRRK